MCLVVFVTPQVIMPILDKLDPNGYVMYRLFRDAAKYKRGAYIKVRASISFSIVVCPICFVRLSHPFSRVSVCASQDLSRLNRPLDRVVVVDHDPKQVQLHPENLVRVPKWDGTNKQDSALLDIIPFLECTSPHPTPRIVLHCSCNYHTCVCVCCGCFCSGFG